MGCVVQYTSCSLSVATSLEIPKHASQAVNNHCFMVLEEQAGDNALYRDSALPYFCRLLLTQETNGMGASPWSHPNEGVCCGVKWSEVKVEEEEKKGGGGGGGWRGAQVPQKSGSGCSTLAAHHGCSQVNVKTRESFAEYRFNAAAWAGGRCVLQITRALFPTHTESPVPSVSTEPEREAERMLFYVPLPSLKSSCVENQCRNEERGRTT